MSPKFACATSSGDELKVELENGDPTAAKARVTEMADKLLANPVIERFTYRIEDT